MTSDPAFVDLPACWICGEQRLDRVFHAIFNFANYGHQDPELAAYTGRRVDLMRCRACGFSQPAALPALPRYFDRMYDQRWSRDWMAREYGSGYKDLIFGTVLGRLSRLLPPSRRTLLDLGAHVGRLMRMAQTAGWTVEGVELNPQTAAFAAEATALPVHRANAATLAAEGHRYDAVTFIDVLEHIPDPVAVLASARRLLAPGGWIAVKVPNGPVQLQKELWRARLVRGYRATVADNLVHVNHFTPSTLALSLTRAGFTRITVVPAAPEIVQRGDAGALRRVVMNGIRRLTYAAALVLPFGSRTPLALHLQAYAQNP